MAISMSEASINTEERDDLLSSNVDDSVVSGGEVANTKTTGGWFNTETTASGSSLAGITPEFASEVSAAIDAYIEEVNATLENLDAEGNSAGAFKGPGVSTALSNFVASVKSVANSYLEKLKTAEQQIINSVATVYETQDTDLSSNLKSDSDKLSASGFSSNSSN